MEIAGALIICGGTIVTATWGVVTQRMIARRRATLDHIRDSQADKDLIDARRRYIKLSTENDGGLAKYAEKSQEGTEDAQAIELVLNEFELIAIGIERGIIDFELYRRYHRSTVIRYWAHAEPFVARLRTRTNNNMYYHEFEQLADWMDEKKKPRRGHYWAVWF